MAHNDLAVSGQVNERTIEEISLTVPFYVRDQITEVHLIINGVTVAKMNPYRARRIFDSLDKSAANRFDDRSQY